MPLSRLAALYGVATSYSPSPGRTVAASDAAVVAALAALGVPAGTPEAVREALTAREAHLRDRLLPPTVVSWIGAAGTGPSGGAASPGEPSGGGAGAASPDGSSRAAGSARTAGSPDAAGSPGTAGRPDSDEGPDAVGSAGPAESAGAAEAAADADGTGLRAGSSLPAVLAALPPGTRLLIRTEQGETRASTERLPPGVHAMEATAPDGRTARAHLVVAPARLPAPPGRTYGLLVQVYSLLSGRSWGMGDLGDLAELASWAGRSLGAGFVQVNPMHAAVPGAPTDPSPYRPSSRRYPDPVHLRVEDVPEFAHTEDRDRLRALLERAERQRASVLHKDALIDRDAVWELKREALELVRDVPLGPGRRAAYCDFLAEEGEALEDHATWCALAEVHGSDWHHWPAALRDPRSAETARARAELMDRVDFHCRLAWLTDAQLSAAQRSARDAGMPVGIVHDLAVGVHPGGADAWAQQEHFAAGMTVGAPPDAFSVQGQDWGLPPWRPDRLAESGYAPYRRLLRALFRYAGALRIDHVMGLFRLWWIPQGRPATEGAYVRYDAEAMLAILALEASRAGAPVIGEDLGTVEPGVRETLHEHGVLGTSVLWFERDWAGTGRPLPPESWRADCLATATTHDLPPTASRLTGDHVELRDRLGLLTRPLAEERAEAAAEAGEWLRLLARLGLLEGSGGGVSEEAEIQALHRFLLRTPARMVGVWLPDAIGDRRPQNLPGTWDQYPNWRLPVADADGRPVTLEELAASPRLYALFDVVRGSRSADAVAPDAEGPAPRTAPPGARPV
ncbi:4-alpha-glucanotransferase [Streptomyces fructofermentans]|uniref:4-alpha-glucanotransferase n=1 Tax=Streptomyces fructofermentans TaxID=152141 RepID=A0A918K9C7_9ACTN|nr:4-alpha-glucanotransferase [Streptomyces fructofermentans]GGX54642.1 4-alpha-glucanotransferase [Streptomyces fructofermentans]